MAQKESDVARKVEIGWLTAFYGPLLTAHQQEVLRLSHEEDHSLGEIAKELGVTRQGVHDILLRAEKQLTHLEEQLGMYRRFLRTQEGLEKALHALDDVQAEPGTAKSLSRAKELVTALLMENEEEENGL